MLPDSPRVSKSLPEERRIKPGTWWRLVNQDHPISQKGIPQPGLILLAQEVRVIDGEDHTILLAPHPTWDDRDPFKILYEDLLTNFVEEEHGETLREAEIAGVMERIQNTGRALQNPPAPALLLEQAKKKEAASPKKEAEPEVLPAVQETGIIPKELLPSQDVLGAQLAVETRMRELELQREWMEGKTGEMRSDMALVQKYQEEKVTGTLAGISQEQKRAEGLLKNVQTMRLFLGEDIQVEHLVKGKSADPSEPLTFLQRLLFLDEEVFISNILEGFDASHMGDLSTLFSEDKSLVQRMMPYERCMVITRIRNKERKRDKPPKDIVDAFMRMEENIQDQMIQMFIRDGENVWMVTADEVTSNAKRLFPSKHEIEGLFTERQGFSKQTRMISPDDIDYSDARAKHDDRALFYKRFLIISWGLHEREGIFGPFMAKDENWLSETTHSERFRFIHDEERGLSDGRPGVFSFIREQNSKLKAGSRVVIKWRDAADEVSAAAICEVNPKTYHTSLKGYFEKDISIATVKADKSSLVAISPFSKRTNTIAGHRKINAKVALKQHKSMLSKALYHNGDPHEIHTSEGFLVLDGISLEDLDYYIESRAARESYANYLHSFHEARKLLIEEQKVIDETLRGADVDQSLLAKSVALWRAGKRWALPRSEKDRKAILGLASKIQKAVSLSASENIANPCRISVLSNGKIMVSKAAEVSNLPEGISPPWLAVREYAKEKSSLEVWSEHGALNELIVHDTLDDMEKQLKATPEGLLAPSCLDGFVNLPAAAKHTDALKRFINGESLDELLSLAKEAIHSRTIVDRDQVNLCKVRYDLGVVYGADHKGHPQSWIASAILNPVSMALHHGMRKDLFAAADSVYQYADSGLDRAEVRRPISMVAYRLHPNRTFEASFQEEAQMVPHAQASLSLLEYHSEDTKGASMLEYVASDYTPRKHTGYWGGATDWDACAENAKKLTFIGAEGIDDFLQEVRRLILSRERPGST